KSTKEINEDYIGFLEVAGCEIFEPVVKGNDNDYYLKHDIYGDQNKAGTIFMDYRCTVTPEYTSPNIVIYGHNQEDGTMFGRLKYYKVDYTKEPISIDFYKNNPVIKFNPEFENSEYLIYGFFVTNALENQDSNGEVFHYHDYIETMNDEYTFNWYQGEVQKRNQIISPVDVQYGDKLLVLSTCSNEFTNSRFVVFARKLRDGESVSDYDFSEARFNSNAKGVDWGAILSGETSATEVPEQEEILDESTTHRKSLNKRNEKTYTTATDEEAVTEAPVTTTAPTAEAATVTTVPESVTNETETETAGSSDSSETDESGTESETDVQTETDENGESVTYSETETSESDTETTTKKKKKATETSETSEVVTSKKKSNKSNK
ncbi:MAG: class B sortase, partial [Oscillospiraceae bacterium]|nr:class B sortase [Oscillospiraceae bacterium]